MAVLFQQLTRNGPAGLQACSYREEEEGGFYKFHYVIHVCRRIFVRRLHRYELEVKPAQLGRAERSSVQRSCVGFSETHSCDVSSTLELCMTVPAGIQQSQAIGRKLWLKYLKNFWLKDTSEVSGKTLARCPHGKASGKASTAGCQRQQR